MPVSLFNKEMKKDNITCSRSPSRQCQSQSGKYPPPVCSGFWLKSNYSVLQGSLLQVRTTPRIQWHGLFVWRTSTWHWEEVRKNSGQTAASVFVGICLMPEERRLWLDDMFHFSSAAECRTISQGCPENPSLWRST